MSPQLLGYVWSRKKKNTKKNDFDRPMKKKYKKKISIIKIS